MQVLRRQRRRFFGWWFVMMVAGVALVIYSFSNYASLIGTLSHYASDEVSSAIVKDPPEDSNFMDMAISKKRRVQWTRSIQNATHHSSLVGLHVFRPHTPVDRILLIGERHSGTTYFTKLLKDCFPDIHVSDVFVNGKHWRQPSLEEVVRVVDQLGSRDVARHLDLLSWWSLKSLNGNIQQAFRSSLVVALFRDPYQWMEAMRQKPHHWPNHVSFRPTNHLDNQTAVEVEQVVNSAAKKAGSDILSHTQTISSRTTSSGIQLPPESTKFGGKFAGGSIQKSFVEHEFLNWTSFVQQNLYLNDYTEDDGGDICQKGYAFVSPCRRNATYVPEGIRHIPRSFLRHLYASANDPVYEMKEDGTPFDNILQMRKTKIHNFLQIPSVWDVAAFAVIPYERLLNDPVEIMTEISKAVNQTPQCVTPTSSTKVPYDLPESFEAWIRTHAHWETETLIGYSDRPFHQ